MQTNVVRRSAARRGLGSGTKDWKDVFEVLNELFREAWLVLRYIPRTRYYKLTRNARDSLVDRKHSSLEQIGGYRGAMRYQWDLISQIGLQLVSFTVSHLPKRRYTAPVSCVSNFTGGL